MPAPMRDDEMIRINQIKLPVSHDERALMKKAAKALRVREEQIVSLNITKQSLDARKKEELKYIYSVDVTVREQEGSIVKRAGNPDVVLRQEEAYRFPGCDREGPEQSPALMGNNPDRANHRPVIIGCGPAGLFCGLMLARAGFAPILLERGEAVEQRKKTVDLFWAGGGLNEESNVQFGEGGAGTFSDGKLNTLVKDPSGRNQEVLRILTQAGADPSILYVNKPHIGTDVLCLVVKQLREEILKLGGEVRFNSRVTSLVTEQGAVRALKVTERQKAGKRDYVLPAEAVVLAVGHSARDTFEMLLQQGMFMEAKPFAVGLRIQHPQPMINLSQYGMEDPKALGAASYKVTAKSKSGRGVYSFCMCPGGFVVNASSEAGRLAVNGMSNHEREGVNANSAVIVTVSPEDFEGSGPLKGMEFQRRLETAAFACAGGQIPAQLYGDYKENRVSTGFGAVEPAFKGGFAFGNLRDILPESLNTSLIEGIQCFGRKISGFDRQDAILAGVESRTSSPVKIPRDEHCESRLRGLYPCGEGAGYAGGITSAAMDGIRVAEAVAERYGKV